MNINRYKVFINGIESNFCPVHKDFKSPDIIGTEKDIVSAMEEVMWRKYHKIAIPSGICKACCEE